MTLSINHKYYRDQFELLLNNTFVSLGYQLSENVEVGAIPESEKYNGLFCGINGQQVVYRKANVTNDRPGAFLAIWQRPASASINNNKLIPLTN